MQSRQGQRSRSRGNGRGTLANAIRGSHGRGRGATQRSLQAKQTQMEYIPSISRSSGMGIDEDS